MSEILILNEDELMHYGVLGMKWGIRRYQPYSVKPRLSGKTGKEIGEASKTHTTANRITRSAGVRRTDVLKEARTKDINKLTNEELSEYNKRLRLEREFTDLTKGELYNGRKYVRKTATTVVTSVVTGIMIEAGRQYVKKKIMKG